MNEQTNATPAASTPSSTPATSEDTTEVDASATDYDQARRRRRRRRRRREQVNTPGQRLHLILLAVVALLLIAAVVGPGATHRIIGSIQHVLPNFAVDISRRTEVVALVIAGLILVYLTPGVEDKILRTLGIRRKEKRGGRRS